MPFSISRALATAVSFAILFLSIISSAAPTLGSRRPFNRIYAFGDSFTDTGNSRAGEGPAGFGHLSSFPYGMTYFKRPTNRYSDGRLTIDFVAQSMNLPFLPPYLGLRSTNGTGTDSYGVNFAVSGATVIKHAFFAENNLTLDMTPQSLETELGWFEKYLETLGTNQKVSLFKDSLFWIGEIGVNDYAYTLGSTVSSDTIRELSLSTYTRFLETLLKKGVRHMVVQGHPATGCLTSIWDSLFRGEDKPTASWIMDRLIMGKKYKDPLTRLRLAMLIIVEGILCPTCGATKIRPEVVSLLENLDEFLQYPWGRESFLLTVKSANARGAGQYVQDTMAIQGFAHAMVLVTVIACPAILGQSIDVDSVASVSEQSKGILSRLLNTKMAVNVVSAKTLDQKGQAIVRPFVCSDEDGECLYGSLLDKSDDAVDKMVALITEDYPFEHNSWPGGVEANALKLKKCQQHPSESSAENILKEMDTKNRNQSGVDSGVRNPEPNRQSPRSNDEDTTFGRTSAVDVPALLRLAADAYEERLMPLFEGYVLSLKAYFDTKVAGLDTSLMAATTSIRELEIFVKSEFAKRSDSFSNQAYGDPLGTFTPTTNPSPNWGPSDKLQNEDVSVYPPSKSANEDNRAGNTPGQNQSKPPNPSAVMSDTHPPQSEDDIVAGDQAPTHPPGSEDAQSTDVPSAANASGCVMAVSTAAESVSTAPHIPATVGDNIVRNDTEEGVNEDLHPNLAEDTRPSKEAKVRRGGSESIGGKLEGTRRVSRRRHNSPQRYTPTEYTIRKKPTNKRGGRGG